jgi:hypothetical protein
MRHMDKTPFYLDPIGLLQRNRRDGLYCYFRLLSIRIEPYALNIMAPFM